MEILTSSWFYFIAYFYGIVIAHAMIKPAQEQLRIILEKEYSLKTPQRIVPILPQVVGLVERALYITALYVQQPLLIGFWLTLKTASRWEIWSKDDKDKIPGRAYFNIFLTGNALSIIYSFASYGFIIWGENQDIPENSILVIAPIIVFIANGLLLYWLAKQNE